MKRISLAALLILITATAQPAAAGTTVPVCPPQWLAELLRGYSISFACAVERDGASGDEGIVQQPRSVAVDLPSEMVPIPYSSRVVPEPRGDGQEAYRDAYRGYSTDARGLSANRPGRRTKESYEAP